MAPQEEVAEFESYGKGDSNNIGTVVSKEKKKEEDQPVNKLVEQPIVQILEEEVQVIRFPPEDRGKSLVLDLSFQTPLATKKLPGRHPSTMIYS